MRPAQPRIKRSVAGFTLVEVILAIVIALGILVVVLYFYHQATSLRSQIIEETERIASARLLMDRITGELRTATADWSVGPAFLGSSNAIEFVKADVPAYSTWLGGPLGRATVPVTDLKRIRYRLESLDGTNVAGVVRSEEPLVTLRRLGAMDELNSTNRQGGAALPPVLESIQFLQFRFWSGTNWTDSWTGSGCPLGVEVSMGSEAVTNALEAADDLGEIFRRVIYLAGGYSPSANRAKAQSNAADAALGEP